MNGAEKGNPMVTSHWPEPSGFLWRANCTFATRRLAKHIAWVSVDIFVAMKHYTSLLDIHNFSFNTPAMGNWARWNIMIVQVAIRSTCCREWVAI